MTFICLVEPAASSVRPGVIAIDCNVAPVIVRTVSYETFWYTALMVAVPTATAVAIPSGVMVATDGVDDIQVTAVVSSWLEPSEKSPVAVSCCLVPAARLVLFAAMETDWSAADVTVRAVDPVTVPRVADTREVPTATPVTFPGAATVATEASADFH